MDLDIPTEFEGAAQWSDGDDGSSIDILAHAREIDPETVTAREQEFDRERSQRLEQDLLAGSSAATVDGESGISSETSSKVARST